MVMNIKWNKGALAAAFLSAASVLCVYSGGAFAQESATGLINYTSDILPIFEARCISCHGEEKQGGDFRMDTKEMFEKGGTFGANVVAENLDESELFKRITLPANHDDVMPAKDDLLSRSEIALIRIWISEGASFDDWTSGGSGVEIIAKSSEDPLLALAKIVSAPSADAIQGITDLGGLASPLYMDSPLFTVNLQLVGSSVTDDKLAALKPLSEQVISLNLAETQVTDSGLAQISSLSNLRTLHLEKTKIGDAGLIHLASLENLEYLNLYESQVGDAGLAHLEGLENLKKIYLWKSNVTDAGAAKLQASLPSLTVNIGKELAQAAAAIAESEEAAAAIADSEEKADDEKDAIDLSALFSEGSCCAKAHADGDECGHSCCVAARQEGKVCTKCNDAPAEVATVDLSAQFAEGSCCAKAHADGDECGHSCCVAAREEGKVCTKCNPAAVAAAPAPVAAKVELSSLFDAGGCCASANASGSECDHACCVAARAEGKACFKCNPGAANKLDLSALFDDGSCCARSQKRRKNCQHACCLAARSESTACLKCNPGAADKIAKIK
jgi:hypothetical protein